MEFIVSIDSKLWFNFNRAGDYTNSKRYKQNSLQILIRKPRFLKCTCN